MATATFCAILVDASRLTVYSGRYAENAAVIEAAGGWWLIVGACLMAFVGAAVGKRLLGKMTIDGVRWLVGALLLVVGALLAAGVI